MVRVCWFVLVGVGLFSATVVAGVGEWKTYTAKRNVRSLALSGETIWGATSGGLFSYRRTDDSFTEFTTSEGLRTIDLTAVVVDAYGAVWAGASNGFLHRYDPKTNQWTYISDIFIRGDPQKGINALEAIGDTLFVLSDIGVSVFSLSRMEFRDTYTRFGSFPNQIVGEVTSMRIYGGNLWIGTRNGIASTSLSNINPSAPESWNVYTTAAGLPSDYINALAIDYDSLFAATRNGLAVFGGATWYTKDSTVALDILGLTSGTPPIATCSSCNTFFITKSSLWQYRPVQIIATSFSSNLTTMLSDSILGSDASGLFLNANSLWISKPPPGPPSNKFVGTAVDQRGTIWGATGAANGEGFMSFDGTRWTSYTVEQDPRLNNDNYYKISIGRNNTKWLSNWGAGVALLDNTGTLRKVLNTANGLPPSLDVDPHFVVVGGVATDRDGTAWITNRTGQGDTAVVKFNVDSSLGYVIGLSTRNPFNVFTDVIIDAYGTKWFANFSRFEPALPLGYYFYNEHAALPGTFNGWGKLTTADGLTSDKVWSEAIDNDGSLWIGSDQGISIIFDPANPQATLAAYHPLRDQIIQGIVVDPLNNKWIATKQGVFLLSSDGTTILNSYTVETTDGKLLDNDVASISMNINSGTVYFGTEKGLSSLTTAAINPNRNLDKLSVAPNPFYLPSNVHLTVDGLVENSTLKVLSVDGRLIREIHSPGGRTGYWDGTDDHGHLVATGVYLVIAYSENGNNVATTKVAVIRK